MNRFENKVVVITGAAGGIGEATTRRIVSEGGKVVIADHSEKKAEQLANELTHAGADVRHVYFSATELQSCKELIDFSMNEYQRIDVLRYKGMIPPLPLLCTSSRPCPLRFWYR